MHPTCRISFILIRVISFVNMCIKLYLGVHLLQNKCALQLKCKCDPPNAHTSSKICALQSKCKCKCVLLMYISSKCVHCNQNTNANVIPNVYSKMHIYPRCDLHENTHLSQISVRFSQDANANKKLECMFQT